MDEHTHHADCRGCARGNHREHTSCRCAGACGRRANRNDERPRWWRYGVLRGDGIPVELDGRWYDLDAMPDGRGLPRTGAATLDATNRWEQRDDGEIAVVYEWVRK